MAKNGTEAKKTKTEWCIEESKKGTEFDVKLGKNKCKRVKEHSFINFTNDECHSWSLSDTLVQCIWLIQSDVFFYLIIE